MSVAELQSRIAKLKPGQRRAVAKYVTRVSRQDSAGHRQQLTETMREMDAGLKYSRAQVNEILSRNPPQK